jgi:hypothetical protein
MSGCGAAIPADGAGGVGAAQPRLGVILTESRASSMVGGLGVEGYSGYWTPERHQVVALERALPEHLATAAPEGSRLRRGLDGYRAQYFGVLRGEQELILANFFCDAQGRDIEQEVVAVEDGGDCYFTVELDPALERFSELSINGES